MTKKAVPTLLFISALLHLYIGLRLQPDLAFSPLAQWSLTVWLVISTLLIPAPLLVRLSPMGRAGDAIGWIGYLAMGVFSSLFVLTILRDLTLATSGLINMLRPDTIAMLTLRENSAVGVIALTVFASLIGVFNARRLAKVVEVNVPIANLPQALQGFSIVQISDIHVGPTIKHGYIRAIVDAVNKLKPDVVAVTGDIVDGSVAHLRKHVAPLGELSARHGVYAVTGNHEYYSGADAWVAELRRLGLHVLMNQNQVLNHDGTNVLIGGVTDYAAHKFDPTHKSDPLAALVGVTQAIAIKVLLAHQPRTAPEAEAAGFDLQLSGHTHGGQFLPWKWFVPLQQPFTAGLHRLRKLWVYTSRGTGYWGPPIRFGAPSEITHLRLVAQ
ncbi:metallophosphoesterase [Stenotrophobium rhamnosiphilum]|uniref:Serine/threonine protein phosphatase n=1 Tax=Stenotrophobium rhamnosiphilum TaxID=2029166 RepID=A0A2T5MJT3_9GAMM|nr:metallophosphoesterase [Stenotrophobium rhamnosiphilum]PTU32837.1 serine/threonine protein phosphatase [Stenotrophobium rhamnosiphilum]